MSNDKQIGSLGDFREACLVYLDEEEGEHPSIENLSTEDQEKAKIWLTSLSETRRDVRSIDPATLSRMLFERERT